MKNLFSIALIAIFAYSNNLIAQTIHIQTKNSSLVFQVEKNKVYQSYFGKHINSVAGIETMGNVYRSAYPAFGDGGDREVALIATHADGTMATDLFYVDFKQTTEGNIQSTTIRLKDGKKPFFVELHFNAYQEESVIEQWVIIRHEENGRVKLEQYASSTIGFMANSYYLTQFYGCWAREMRVIEEPLTSGIKSIETKRGIRATEFENPSFILSLNQPASEDNGEVVMGALAWQGNFRLNFEVDNVEICQMTAGINPFASAYNLESGKEFKTPRMILTYSDAGKNGATINMHRWARKYNLRDGDKERPIVLNSWEGAYFDFDAARLKSMMDGAAEMGAEMFVLDDGWFGNKYPRNNDKAGLGDWQVNKTKLPNGLGDLIDYAESKGLKFGIWLEPEMVNPASELAKNHPDWIIQRKNYRELLLQRTQLVLDLSNPKVQDFAFGALDELLKQNPRIAYVKWDANRNIQNFGSTYLGDSDQSMLWIEYAKGLENVMSRFAAKYPNVILQDCSSGGGRVEYGSLKYAHEFWASDCTDPFERLFVQWGTNHIYPAIATGAHVTKSPNHQTERDTPLKFRFDMAMSGRLGIEMRPSDFDAEDLIFAKKAVETYKKIRPIIQFGDLYRIQSPYDTDGFASINYVTVDKLRAVWFVYSHNYHNREEQNLFRVKGLDPNGKYQITELNMEGKKSVIPCNQKILSGDLLMQRGIEMQIKKPLDSGVFLLEKVN